MNVYTESLVRVSKGERDILGEVLRDALTEVQSRLDHPNFGGLPRDISRVLAQEGGCSQSARFRILQQKFNESVYNSLRGLRGRDLRGELGNFVVCVIDAFEAAAKLRRHFPEVQFIPLWRLKLVWSGDSPILRYDSFYELPYQRAAEMRPRIRGEF